MSPNVDAGLNEALASPPETEAGPALVGPFRLPPQLLDDAARRLALSGGLHRGLDCPDRSLSAIRATEAGAGAAGSRQSSAVARVRADGRRDVRARAQQARAAVHAADFRDVLRDSGRVRNRDGRDVMAAESGSAGPRAVVARALDRRRRRDHPQPSHLDARRRARRGDDLAGGVRDQLRAARLHAAAVGNVRPPGRRSITCSRCSRI